MRNRYRVLAAMLALKRFTVADLARVSRVNINTVRTLMRELSSYCVPDDGPPPEQRMPGGQTKRYRLSQEQRAWIERELGAQRLEIPPDAGDAAYRVPAKIQERIVQELNSGEARAVRAAARAEAESGAAQKNENFGLAIASVDALLKAYVGAGSPGEAKGLLEEAAATLPAAQAEVAAARRSGRLEHEAMIGLQNGLRSIETRLSVAQAGASLVSDVTARTHLPSLAASAAAGSVRVWNFKPRFFRRKEERKPRYRWAPCVIAAEAAELPVSVVRVGESKIPAAVTLERGSFTAQPGKCILNPFRNVPAGSHSMMILNPEDLEERPKFKLDFQIPYTVGRFRQKRGSGFVKATAKQGIPEFLGGVAKETE